MEEKIGYIFTNAIRWGLSTEGWDYPGFYLKGSTGISAGGC
jgi:hypothetical protein